MRSYACNSPQAAARVVALAALADGHISRSELGALERLDVHGQLGLAPGDLYEVVQHLSEDLLASAYPQWGTTCQIDPQILQSLMAEITDPGLRRTTLALCAAVAQADFHISEAEDNLIGAAARRWAMPHPLLQPAN